MVFGLAAVCAVVLGLSACGGGETTVTVTEGAQPPATQQGGSTESSEPQSGNGVVTGYVDHVVAEGEAMVLNGWAAAADFSGPADQVTASVGGKTLAKAVPTLKRQDVVEALNKPGLENSGFELRLPLKSLECSTPYAGIEMTASIAGRSGDLLFGEGIKEAIANAC